MFSWCCFVVAVLVFKNDRKEEASKFAVSSSLRFGQKNLECQQQGELGFGWLCYRFFMAGNHDLVCCFGGKAMLVPWQFFFLAKCKWGQLEWMRLGEIKMQVAGLVERVHAVGSFSHDRNIVFFFICCSMFVCLPLVLWLLSVTHDSNRMEGVVLECCRQLTLLVSSA